MIRENKQTIKYLGIELISNEYDTKTPTNTLSALTIANYDQTYTNEMNGIIALVIANDQACFEQPFLMLPVTLACMIDMKIKILKENNQNLITGLIIIPPNKNLEYGIHKLCMNKLSIIIDVLDVVIFSDNECTDNLVILCDAISNSIESKFEGFKFLKTIKYRHFTSKAYDEFKINREIMAKNPYKKHLCRHRLLVNYVSVLITDFNIKNIIIEAEKNAYVYRGREKIIIMANINNIVLVRESKYRLILAATIWNNEQCINIMKRYLNAFLIKKDGDEKNIDNIINDIVSNYDSIINSYEANDAYNFDNTLIFATNENGDNIIDKAILENIIDKAILKLAVFYKINVGPKIIEDIDYLKKISKKYI
jgi:hypothetical protein